MSTHVTDIAANVRLRQVVGMMPGLLTRSDDEVVLWVERCTSLLHFVHTALEVYAMHACPCCIAKVPDLFAGPRTPPDMQLTVTVSPTACFVLVLSCAEPGPKIGAAAFRLSLTAKDACWVWQYMHPTNPVMHDFKGWVSHMCVATGLSIHLPFFAK